MVNRAEPQLLRLDRYVLVPSFGTGGPLGAIDPSLGLPASRGGSSADPGSSVDAVSPFVRVPRSLRLPPIQLGPVAVTGRLAEELIIDEMEHHLGRIRNCYAFVYVDDQSVAGGVTVAFTIEGKTGQVVNSYEDGSDLPVLEIGRCLARLIAHLEFPPSSDGEPVRVVYHAKFEPGTAPDD